MARLNRIALGAAAAALAWSLGACGSREPEEVAADDAGADAGAGEVVDVVEVAEVAPSPPEDAGEALVTPAAAAGPVDAERVDAEPPADDGFDGLGDVFALELSADTLDQLALGAGVVAELAAEGGVALSGGPATAADDGAFGGAVSIQVPMDVENAAVARAVRVQIIARAPLEAGTPVFHAAYSTNEAGNEAGGSGWRAFTPTTSDASYEFMFETPANDAMGGDYVGLLPDPEQTGGVVIISAIRVAAVDPAP